MLVNRLYADSDKKMGSILRPLQRKDGLYQYLGLIVGIATTILVQEMLPGDWKQPRVLSGCGFFISYLWRPIQGLNIGYVKYQRKAA